MKRLQFSLPHRTDTVIYSTLIHTCSTTAAWYALWVYSIKNVYKGLLQSRRYSMLSTNNYNTTLLFSLKMLVVTILHLYISSLCKAKSKQGGNIPQQNCSTLESYCLITSWYANQQWFKVYQLFFSRTETSHRTKNNSEDGLEEECTTYLHSHVPISPLKV